MPLFTPLHPEVTVQLTGTDGNAFAIIGKVSQALRRAKIDPAPFQAEAMSGDYDNLLMTAMRWVDVE
jgi:hypothetical protein